MTSQVRAPELDAGIAWLNTDRPLRIKDELRGQLVVLDFWTYCCINCIHILPDLAYLEHKYANEPVMFIGVHSAKFNNEANPETIRQAILRYEIQHPVVVDDGMKLWRSYAVRSWPTVVVIDSRGYVTGSFGGEGNREWLDQRIAEALAQGRTEGTLASGPITVQRESPPVAASGLAFPGKVLADAQTNRLYVADSNHNRIVIAERPDARGHAEMVAVVGSGAIGKDDGPADRATFDHPQGLAVAHGVLYVADTENHLIRAVDLATHEVTTVVGTGEMTYDFSGGGMGVQQGINSPWDLVIEGSTLYVAMAGTHQIWRMDMPVGFARALAGTGRENLVDGPTEKSAFAQPSGICAADGVIYVADSEVSAIRGIDMATERVFTILGQGLFYFGDEDGTYPRAKLQHPLGIAPWGSSLLVADTYNHKIKVVDPKARSVRTVYGTGEPGVSAEGGKVALFEPGGLSVWPGTQRVGAQGDADELFVADTNNHRVVRIDLATHEWCEVVFTGLTAPASRGLGEAQAFLDPSVNGADSARAEARGSLRTSLDTGYESQPLIQSEPVAVSPDRDVELLLDIVLPPGSHLNNEAPWTVRVTVDGTPLLRQTGRAETMPLCVKVSSGMGATDRDWIVRADFTYCRDGESGSCVPAEVAWRVPVRRGDAHRVMLRGAVA